LPDSTGNANLIMTRMSVLPAFFSLPPAICDEVLKQHTHGCFIEQDDAVMRGYAALATTPTD